MNATNRLNLLLSDILQNEPSSTNKIYHGSINPTSSLLTFAGQDYHPSITAIAPLPTRRNASARKHHRQRQYIHQSDNPNQQQTQPLLNSSTLDDLFRAFTLECEQYLSASSKPSYQNKTYDQLIVQPSTTIQTNIDSNDDDYENLHPKKYPLPNGLSSLRTSIEVMSPEKRQIVSINVSSKKSSSPTVPSSQTYPLLSTSCTIPSIVSSNICHSSEEDSVDVSSSSTNRKRRRRIRKQQMIPSKSSSDDERIETINGLTNEKKSTISKRSCSTDYRQQRIRSIYDNHPISISSQKNPSSRRTRRRDVSLQQHVPSSTKYNQDTTSGFQNNLCSPLSVLLTSTSDFIDRSQQRRSRLELVNHQPLTLLDRMHQQFYRTSPTNHNNNIPTQRIPSYPVY